jgi:hypothetical protein
LIVPLCNDFPSFPQPKAPTLLHIKAPRRAVYLKNRVVF